MMTLKSRKDSESGYGLIEIVIVMIIIGILAAIAIPIFKNQSNKVEETEIAVSASSLFAMANSQKTPNGMFRNSIRDAAQAVDTSIMEYGIQIYNDGQYACVWVQTTGAVQTRHHVSSVNNKATKGNCPNTISM